MYTIVVYSMLTVNYANWCTVGLLTGVQYVCTVY